jgi:hypothetical protein
MSNTPEERFSDSKKRNIPRNANDSEGVARGADAELDGTTEKGEGLQVPPEWANDAPDGGLTAWLVVLGAWCTSFCTFGWVNSTLHSSGL